MLPFFIYLQYGVKELFNMRGECFNWLNGILYNKWIVLITHTSKYQNSIILIQSSKTNFWILFIWNPNYIFFRNRISSKSILFNFLLCLHINGCNSMLSTTLNNLNMDTFTDILYLCIWLHKIIKYILILGKIRKDHKNKF